MKTKQLNVRLSETAWSNLAAICQASGINQTAAIEIALAALTKGLTKGENEMITPETLGVKKVDARKIIEKNNEILREYFVGIASDNYYNCNGLSYQLYLDLDDDTMDIKVEASGNTWSQRDDGSLIKIMEISGYSDIPENELYTNGCDIYDYGFTDWLDGIEEIIDNLEQ
jgi:hypothetical protein